MYKYKGMVDMTLDLCAAQWKSQRIALTCLCGNATDLDIFDSVTCPKCGRQIRFRIFMDEWAPETEEPPTPETEEPPKRGFFRRWLAWMFGPLGT